MNLTPLFKLAHYSVFRLFAIFALAWFVLQYVMYIVERMIWGVGFLHWGDLIMTIALAGAFGYVAYMMGMALVIRINLEKESD